jgi:sortase A
VIFFKRMERGFWAAGAACAVWCLFCLIEAHAVRSSSATPSSPDPEAPSGTSLGRIEIPALHLAVPVVEDDDTRSLLAGLGHIRGTAYIGGLGTTALAGHRDRFLRPLRHVALKMQILATNQSGTYRYIVDSTEIVDPSQVRVLAIRNRPELVLVTCYPFNYIGHAPRRFIVHAHLVSVDPDRPSGSAAIESRSQ